MDICILIESELKNAININIAVICYVARFLFTVNCIVNNMKRYKKKVFCIEKCYYHMKNNNDKSHCKFLNDYFIFTLQLSCRIFVFFCTIDNNYVRWVWVRAVVKCILSFIHSFFIVMTTKNNNSLRSCCFDTDFISCHD